MRFVSSPEILERFVTIETELEQIESSVQSNELLNADAEGMLGTMFFVRCNGTWLKLNLNNLVTSHIASDMNFLYIGGSIGK